MQLLSSEANEIATKENKCTIQPEHVMKALQELGFGEFADEVSCAWDEHKEEVKGEVWGLAMAGLEGEDCMWLHCGCRRRRLCAGISGIRDWKSLLICLAMSLPCVRVCSGELPQGSSQEERS